MARLRVDLLGPVRVFVDDVPRALTPAQTAVVALLVLERPRPVPAAALVRAMDGGTAAPRALPRLRETLSTLRAVLHGTGWDLVHGPDTVALRTSGLDLTVDVDALPDLVRWATSPVTGANASDPAMQEAVRDRIRALASSQPLQGLAEEPFRAYRRDLQAHTQAALAAVLPGAALSREPLRYSLFGTVTARCGGVPLPLDVPQVHRFLGLLLVRRGVPVAAAEAAGVLWPGDPSAGAGAVRACAALLSQAWRLSSPAVVEMPGPHWRLDVPAGMVDVDVAASLAGAAATAQDRGATDEAATLLRRALDAVDGEPLAGLTGEPFDSERRRLTAWREDVRRRCVAAEVAAGREAAALADLASLVEDAPLDEPLLELYLGALLRAGRPAQALAAHDAADRRMHRALGTGPGPTIRALARQARDAVASAGPPTGGRTSSAAPTMRGHGRARLRATVLRMIGRDDLGARWRTLSPGGAAPATRSSSLLPPLFGARTELSRSRRQTVLAWAMTLVTWVGTPWAAPVLLAALAIGGRVASREHLATAATLWAAVALALTTNDFAGAPVAIFAVSLLSTAHVSALLLLSPYR